MEECTFAQVHFLPRPQWTFAQENYSKIYIKTFAQDREKTFAQRVQIFPYSEKTFAQQVNVSRPYRWSTDYYLAEIILSKNPNLLLPTFLSHDKTITYKLFSGKTFTGAVYNRLRDNCLIQFLPMGQVKLGCHMKLTFLEKVRLSQVKARKQPFWNKLG